MRPPVTPRERAAPEPGPAPGQQTSDAPVPGAPGPADQPPTLAEGQIPDETEAAEQRSATEEAITEAGEASGPEPSPARPVPRASQEPATRSAEDASAGAEAGARFPAGPRTARPLIAESPGSVGEPVTDLADPPPAWPGRPLAAAWPALPLLVALALWAYALRHTDVSDLDDFGLVSALYPTFWAGLVTLTAGFWFTVRDPRRRQGWSLAYVVGLLLMERATQALVYPTPLYAWAWKHDAVIDHLLTHGGLQTEAQLGDMAVYDQWPGFFAAQAALVRLLGVDDTTMYMAWWPLVSSLLLLIPLLLIYRTFTTDRRLVWTAVWLFYVANWVGQDYFSPQSVAFVLHVGVLAVVLRRYGGRRGGRGRQRPVVWTVLLTLLVTTIVVAHQLTPGMLVVSLLALCLTRRYRDWVPAVTTVVLFLAWCLTAALPFLSAAMPEMIRSIGDVGANVETGYGATPTGTGAVATSWAARLLSGSVLLLAALGVLRQPVLRYRAMPLLLVAAAPLPMLGASSYGSEMIFRVLMFMLPGAAFFAAAALLPKVRTLAADLAAREAAARRSTATGRSQAPGRPAGTPRPGLAPGSAPGLAPGSETAVPPAGSALARLRFGVSARLRSGALPRLRSGALPRLRSGVLPRLRSGVLPRLRFGVWAPLPALLAGVLAFVPAYSGKDRINYFPPQEVALVQDLFDQAPDGSLVVAANRNYPLAYDSYWRVDHYWFLDDGRGHVDRIVRSPAATLARDMAGVEPPGRAYLLLTQGQVANSEMNGQLDAAQLDRIRRSVAASPRFRLVAENDAGVLYVLRPAS